jgi:Rrf2 family nitric oxide-sensitive transcriptional repressor
MRMTLHADYSLRLLTYLGLASHRLVTAEEVAQAYGLSKNHLMKVILGLSRAGHIETIRGRGGGIRLARAPDAIGIGKVIRDMEEDLAIVECLGDHNSCIITGACRLRSIMREALNAYLAVLDRYSLADLLQHRRALGQLLGLDLPEPADMSGTG